MIIPDKCPRCRQDMRPVWGVDHYAVHYCCNVCRRVYVKENGTLIICAHPEEHIQDPPWWAKKKEKPETPPLRAHDNASTK